MPSIRKASFKSRDNNLNFFCPLCGHHTMTSTGDINPCKHLALVHLNIADPAIMYALPGLADETSECCDWTEIEEVLSSQEGLDELLVIEELSAAPAMAEFQIVYAYFDDE